MSQHTHTPALARAASLMWRWSPPVVLARFLWNMTARQWKVGLATFFGTMLLSAGIAFAADPGAPAGLDSFLSIPDYSNGAAKTLTEEIPTSRYTIDHAVDNNPVNIIDKAGNGMANAVWSLAVALAQILMVLIAWLLGNSDVGNDTFNLTDLISSASTETMAWLFPTCLAVAAVAVWVDHKRDKTGASGLLTVGIIGVLAAGFSLFPGVFVSGMDTVRAAGQDVVTATMPDGDDAVSSQPFEYGSPDLSQNTDNEAFTRQVTDSLWRSAVVTPWCMVEFGNLEACEKYGTEMLTRDNAEDRRDDVIKKQIFKDDELGGKDGEVGQWVHGKKWPERLGMAFVALVVSLLMLVMAAVLVFTAIIAFIQALLLLFLASFFLVVGMIPGAPREWLRNWSMAFAGAVLASVITMLLLVVTMGAITGIFLNPELPWAQGYGLAILVLAAALGLRSVVKHLTHYSSDATGGGAATRLIRTLMMRRALNTLTKGRGGPGSRGRNGADSKGDSRGGSGVGGKRNSDTVYKRMEQGRLQQSQTPSSNAQRDPRNAAQRQGGDRQDQGRADVRGAHANAAQRQGGDRQDQGRADV
ncbi:hypothetical protein, partial [Kocuria sp.]|uniref:hypothetical protein n=1 Tax=Kocuria sp. TaxID=1871328 RepID=UPI0028A1FE41